MKRWQNHLHSAIADLYEAGCASDIGQALAHLHDAAASIHKRKGESTRMTTRRVRICRFDSTLDISGRNRTYEAIKARVLEVGRFSVFEATSSAANARLFSRLAKDPELEITSKDFPWTQVKRREKEE